MVRDSAAMGGMGPQIDGAEALSALEWWLEAGVGMLVDEQPRNWLREKPQGPAEPNPEPLVKVAAAAPETLALFREWLANTPGTQSRRSKPVLPQGEEAAEVMLIVEAPGREEALAGAPIAGEAAALMDRMLGAIGLSRSQAYFANLSCFYAPGARPNSRDLEECAETMRRHIALAKPKRLILLGEAPARALLGKPLPEARGHVHRLEGIRAVVTFHPRFLLDHPSNKAQAWKDLLLLMDEGQ